MYDQYAEGIAHTNYVVGVARTLAPQDIFTRLARALVLGITTVLGFVLMPVQLVTTFLGGCLIALTLGLLLFVLSLVWLPILGLLLGSSWLWLRVPILRPLLLLPGVLVAVVADVYVTLIPDPERDSKYTKLCLAGEWPLSWWHLKTPVSWTEAPEADR